MTASDRRSGEPDTFRILICQVPYDSGHRGVRMGAGPLHLVEHGRVPDRLRRAGVETSVVRIEAMAPFPTEIGSAFELHRALADAVAGSVRAGALPLVLSGNCNSSIGTVSGLLAAEPDAPVGVVWFDGHGDCNTPETFTGDFLDAMGLSTLTGRCWQALSATVPGFRPVPDAHVVLIGGHGMDEGARSVLSASRIANVAAADLQIRGAEAALGPVLDRMREAGVKRVYLHLDVDVLDAERVAPANAFAPAQGGLIATDLEAALATVAARFAITAAAVASYDPALDREGRVLRAAAGFLEKLADLHAPGCGVDRRA
jgi:arginase